MKSKTMAVILCLVAVLLAGALLPKTVARADDAPASIVEGEPVGGNAVYAEALSSGTVRFTVSFSGMAEGDTALVGLMRSEGALPSAERGERSLVFALEQGADSLLLSVYRITATAEEALLEGESVGTGAVSVELVRSAQSGYMLTVNGQRYIRNYADLLSDLSVNDFALMNRTHLALSMGGGTATFTGISSDTAGESSVPPEWLLETSAVSGTDGQGEFTNEAASYSVWQNAAYVSVGLRLDLSVNGKTSLAFSDSFVPLAAGASANGFRLDFYRNAGGVYLDVSGVAAGTERLECSRVRLGGEGTLSAQVELKKKSSATGFVLLVNGERITAAGRDALDSYAATEVSRYIDGSTRGVYVSLAAENSTVRSEGISSMTYDPAPVANVLSSAVVNESAYGSSASEWSGDVEVGENGVMTSAGGAVLGEELDTEYVAFDLGFEYLSDATQVLDSYVAFGLSAEGSSSAVLPGDSGPNAIFFLLSLRDGLLHISGYARYEGEQSNFLSWTALPDVSVQNDLRIEFVYYDYDLTLYINGEPLTTSYGSNPLNDYYSIYFENENYKTRLCFANYCFADESKPTLTAENCAKYRVYNIGNDLPDAYIPEGLSSTESEDFAPERMNVWLGVVLPAACVLVLAAAAFCVFALAGKDRGARPAAEDPAPNSDKEE